MCSALPFGLALVLGPILVSPPQHQHHHWVRAVGWARGGGGEVAPWELPGASGKVESSAARQSKSRGLICANWIFKVTKVQTGQPGLLMASDGNTMQKKKGVLTQRSSPGTVSPHLWALLFQSQPS